MPSKRHFYALVETENLKWVAMFDKKKSRDDFLEQDHAWLTKIDMETLTGGVRERFDAKVTPITSRQAKSSGLSIKSHE